MKTLKEFIDKYELKPHPEGGYFSEYYRSAGLYSFGNKSPEFDSPRNYSTAIYYLLDGANISKLHKIKSDELWHFYDGSPLNLYKINKVGELEQIVLGRGENMEISAVVYAGEAMSAKCSDANSFSFVGCTVSPGFDFHDFTMLNSCDLIEKYKNLKTFIEKFS